MGWLATVKSLPGTGPSYHATGVRGRLRFDRSLPKKRDYVSQAQGLSGEAMKGNPTTTVIPRVDESKSSRQATDDLTEPGKPITGPAQNHSSLRKYGWKFVA